MKFMYHAAMLVALIVVTFCSTVPAQAQIGVGGFLSVTREERRETGDFRLACELRNTGDTDPYWAWLGTSNEELSMPNHGSARFSFILVTDDGKPVTRGAWSTDQRKPIEEWHDLEYGPNGFTLDYKLSGARVGIHTLHFIGGIKGGKKNYFRVAIFTMGGKSKFRNQGEGLQFKVYDLEAVGQAPDVLGLVAAQVHMAAGGSSLVGPAIEPSDRPFRLPDAHLDRPRPIEERYATPAPSTDREVERREEKRTAPAHSPVIVLDFQGFESWVRTDWYDRSGNLVSSQYAPVSGVRELKIPQGAETFNLFIVSRDGDRGGVQVRNNNSSQPFRAVDQLKVTITRSRQGG